MQTQTIRRMIKEAIAIDKQTGTLEEAVYGLAVLRGIQLSPEQISNVHIFIQEYIEHAPALLDQIASAARKVGIIDQVMPILKAAEQYFLAPVDIIPDSLGLLGLVDDAYLTHSLMQALSNSYREQTGNTLLPMDLTRINQFIRGLIDEPLSSMLDVRVANVLDSSDIQQSFLSLLGSGSGFNITGPDPMWGHATMDEIVDARLGALGVV